MKVQLDVESLLEVGRTGDFEVTYEGRPVYSKRKQNRFPQPGEVEDLVARIIEDEAGE